MFSVAAITHRALCKHCEGAQHHDKHPCCVQPFTKTHIYWVSTGGKTKTEWGWLDCGCGWMLDAGMMKKWLQGVHLAWATRQTAVGFTGNPGTENLSPFLSSCHHRSTISSAVKTDYAAIKEGVWCISLILKGWSTLMSNKKSNLQTNDQGLVYSEVVHSPIL